MKKLLVLAFLLLALPVVGDWDEERGKIAYLLEQIGQVEGAFIRNGTAHQPKEAVAHLEMKLNRALNSWFAPDKEEWTAGMFIEKLASKSSVSGKPYQIQFADGRRVNAREWLSRKLKAFPPHLK